MTFNTKLTAVIQAIGADIKALNLKDTELDNKFTQAIKDLKAEILGEGVPESLDTLKEIADQVTALQVSGAGSEGGSATVGQAITDKLTELKAEIDDVKSAYTNLNTNFDNLQTDHEGRIVAIETSLTNLDNLDLVATYTTAKNL